MAERQEIRLPLIVWIVSDAKPGHVNQTLGLADALSRATPTEVVLMRALPRWRGWLGVALKRFDALGHSAPDLIVGAGHGTHASMLAAQRAHGGKTIVLMKPSLPRAWFDLCIVPEHDGVESDEQTLVTEGALNRVVPSASRDPSKGLVLIGGESPHFDWDSDAIHVQIKSIVTRSPNVTWTLTTSRRTPSDFVSGLPVFPNLVVVPHAETTPDWLPGQLARSATAWVTPDSASMVYEALTAGADVGVFDLPVRPKSRVGWAIAHLADAGRVTRFVNWCAHGVLKPNLQPLAEADRCAAWILEWLNRKN